MWSTLNFGKHSGKSLPQVLFADPDWFFWAVEKEVFHDRPLLKTESELLLRRARNIKIPASRHPDPVVEYFVHHPTGKFAHFDVIPRDRGAHIGSSRTFRSDVIDMSVPRRLAPYDKTGCKSLVSSLKHHVFGNKSARITRERAEAFFDDASNFS